MFFSFFILEKENSILIIVFMFKLIHTKNTDKTTIFFFLSSNNFFFFWILCGSFFFCLNCMYLRRQALKQKRKKGDKCVLNCQKPDLFCKMYKIFKMIQLKKEKGKEQNKNYFNFVCKNFSIRTNRNETFQLQQHKNK